MPTFSFDISSDYDKAEMNNVFAQTEREIANRYDFKGTPATIEWLENKSGIRLIGAGQWQLDALLDIVRKKLSAKVAGRVAVFARFFSYYWYHGHLFSAQLSYKHRFGL